MPLLQIIMEVDCLKRLVESDTIVGTVRRFPTRSNQSPLIPLPSTRPINCRRCQHVREGPAPTPTPDAQGRRSRDASPKKYWAWCGKSSSNS